MILSSFFFAFYISLIQSVIYLEPHQDWEIPTYENLFKGYTWGCNNYRIPSVAYLKDDSILALTDFRYNHAGDLPAKIGVGGRKRFNNGTWTSGFIITGTPVRNVGDGDVATIIDRKTGCIFAVWSGDKGFQGGAGSISTAENPAHVYFSRSWDNGESWEDRHDITHFIYSNLCTKCNSYRHTNITRLFVTSGNGCQMRDGRLVFATLAGTNDNKIVNYVLYTDDMGDTWDLAEGVDADLGADEAKLVEVNSGDLMISIRKTWSRTQQWSHDAGQSWYRTMTMQNITHYRTNGDLRRMTSVIDGYEKNRILHSLIFHGNNRRNVSLMVSYDEGETWPYRKSIEYIGSAYSSFDITKEGEIFVFFEKDGETTYDMNMAKLSLEWLTDGADHYEKPKLLKWCYLNDPKNENEASKCPEGTYKFGYKVFDQYVESYMVYPKEMQYTFVDKFRNFDVDLSNEGLNTANYNRLSANLDDRTIITFNGQSTDDHPSRTITINNFDVSIPAAEVPNINLKLTNGDITFKNCSSIDIFVSSDSDKLGIRKWDNNDKLNIYSITSTNNIIFEVSGDVNVYHPSEYPSNRRSQKLSKSSSVSSIQLVSTSTKKPATVKMIGNWNQEQGNKISFSQDNTHKMTVIVNSGSENSFDNSGSDDSKPTFEVISDQTSVPTSDPTSVPTSDPTSVPTSVPTSDPTSVPTSVPTSDPTADPTAELSVVPTYPQSPSNIDNGQNDNKDKKSKSVSLPIAILIGFVGLVIGLAIGLIVLFVTRKRRSSKDGDESQSGLVFTPILD